MSDVTNALLYPFTQGRLKRPARGRGVMLRAAWGTDLDSDWQGRLICEQSFKPDFDALGANGFNTLRQLIRGGFDLGLCLLTKHKAENFANIARAWEAVKPGGTIVCAGRVDTGAASIASAVKDVVGHVETLAKYHCKVFWFERIDVTPPRLLEWRAAGRLGVVPQTGYVSCPGLYSWDKIDRGSALLVDHLPNDLGGRVADLGAGWGYLSAEMLSRFPGITSLDLFEAEGLALDAASTNLAARASNIQARYHWHDIKSGIDSGEFDIVVMNPPFHEGKTTDVALGKSFITAAGQILGRGGRLFMVANRQLPYEEVINRTFRRHCVLAETGLFKVIEATK